MKRLGRTGKIIAFGVCIVILLTSTVLINAGDKEMTLEDNSKVRIESDTDLQRVVVVTTPEGIKSTITYDKNKKDLKILQTEKTAFGILTEKVLKNVTIKIKPLVSEKLDDNYRGTLGKIVAKKTETWTNYAYRVRHLNPNNRWWLKTRRGQKVRYVSSRNKLNLKGFMSRVDKMAECEMQIYASCSGTLATTIGGVLAGMMPTGILTPFAVAAAAILAAGGSVAAGVIGYHFLEAKDKADYYYSQV